MMRVNSGNQYLDCFKMAASLYTASMHNLIMKKPLVRDFNACFSAQ